LITYIVTSLHFLVNLPTSALGAVSHRSGYVSATLSRNGLLGGSPSAATGEGDRPMQESPPVSTTEASSASSALSLPAIVCIVGGALSVIASFLPWANVSADLSSLGLAKFSQNVNGMDGDGMITLIFGIALIVVGGLLFGLKGRGITALGIIGALAGLIAAGTAIYDISTVKSTTISDFAGSTAASAGIPVAQAQQLLERFHFSISV